MERATVKGFTGAERCVCPVGGWVAYGWMTDSMFFEHVTLDYLKPQSSQLFGKGAKTCIELSAGASAKGSYPGGGD